ncbi:MAG: EF-hand domain-containing protein [Vicinamibacteraceae bacterium]
MTTTTISPFLERKLARRFRTYDSDGDGFIEQEDFALATTRMADAFGCGGTPVGQRLTEFALQLWRQLAAAADVDADGRISLAEYKGAFAKGLLETPENFDKGYMPFLDAIMAIADTDGDGKLNPDEYVRWTGSLMRLPETDGREVFRKLDRDGDGYVTTTELLNAIHEYYFNEDPHSSGSWLLGALDPE